MNLFEQASHCLSAKDPDEKMERTRELASLWKTGSLSVEEATPLPDQRTDCPELGRSERPVVVMPRDVPKRKLTSSEGQAAMLHALAHIEWTAVNLSWDSVLRFRDLPREFIDDWVQTADEERTHFLGLRDALRALGYDYGDFPVHDQLWQMAVKTRTSLEARMGVVHRILEARALDVVPGICRRFEALGCSNVVKVLEMIANDEVGHVNASSRWFRFECKRQGTEPEQRFFELIYDYMKGPLRGPFNRQARLKAGFSDTELDRLEAEGARS